MPQLAEKVPPSVAGAVLRAVFALPDPVRRLIAGRPVVRDGQRLALDAQLLLLMTRLEGASLTGATVPEARQGLARGQRYINRLPERPVRTRDLAAADGIPARLYEPKGLAEGSPLLVFFHGGGWVIGDIESHDSVCRYLAVNAEVRVLSVDYRLAPEHRFPAAADDALAAYAWAVENAAALGASPEAVAVGGDSAGGNLAAVVGAFADRRPDFALLFYLVLVFGWSLLSMFAPDQRQPLQRLLGVIVDPLLRPLRGRLVVGMIDFSPTVVIIGLLLARILVAAPLLDLGMRLAVVG